MITQYKVQNKVEFLVVLNILNHKKERQEEKKGEKHKTHGYQMLNKPEFSTSNNRRTNMIATQSQSVPNDLPYFQTSLLSLTRKKRSAQRTW